MLIAESEKAEFCVFEDIGTFRNALKLNSLLDDGGVWGGPVAADNHGNLTDIQLL